MPFDLPPFKQDQTKRVSTSLTATVKQDQTKRVSTSLTATVDSLYLEAGRRGLCGGSVHNLGISEVPFFNWKKKFHNKGVAELRRLRQMEEVNQLLKLLFSDLSLDKEMLQDVLNRKF